MPNIPKGPTPPDNERVRLPMPLLKRRVPSGRGATEQPNATGDGDAALNSRFWVALVITGVAAGVFGALTLLLLFTVQHLAFNYSSGPFEQAVKRSSDVRRLTVLLIAGAFGGSAWYLLRRYTKGEKSEVDDSIWRGDARLSFRRCLGTGLIADIVTGLGASLGREQAPKLMGAASGSVVSGGAGAGLAAVYNVPLGGALFTIEVLLGSSVLPAVLPALACSALATLTAWAYLPTHATYVDIPAYHFSGPIMVCAIVMGPVVGVLSSGYIRLIGWVSYHRISGLKMIPAMLAAFGLLGLIGFEYPQS
jgi:CIC family chloride channel protein